MLGLTLRSVQMQDLAEWECIVVDDASLDDAVQVAQSFAAIDQRFVILAHDQVRGLSAARNTGIAAARAPLVCFLDDDDLLLKGSLRGRIEALRDQPPNVVGAYCDWVGIDPLDRLEQCSRRRTARGRHDVNFADLAAGAPFVSSSPVLKIEALEATGGFDETLPRAEDLDMWLRVTRAGYRFVYAPVVGIGYRRSPGSMVIGSPELQLECMLQALRNADLPKSKLPIGASSSDTRTLSAAGFELGYASQILTHLAVLATTDLDRAVRIGCREFTESFRRNLEPRRYVASLTSSVSARLVRTSPAEVSQIRERIVVLLDRLVSSAGPFRVEQESEFDRDGLRGRSQRIRAPQVTSRSLAEAFDGSVILVPESAYHVDELGPLHDELVRRGVKTWFMAAARQFDTTTFAVGRYAGEILPFDPTLVVRAAGLVVLNDWARSRPALDACNREGIPTFAKVEGVQDFDDVDTGQVRYPYLAAAVILGQGQNDVDALPERDVRVVGSSRLERIWQAPASSPGRHALVNLNFTYAVLADRRQAWMKSVEEGARRAGVDAIVSRHPAEEQAPSSLPSASKPFRYEINRAGVLISRFSTVPFEAMARGIPFVYHNPHGERVPTFAEPRVHSSSVAQPRNWPTHSGLHWRGGSATAIERRSSSECRSTSTPNDPPRSALRT